MTKKEIAIILLVVAGIFLAASDRHHRPANLTNKVILPKIPGVINPNVTQRNIMGSVCRSGYTRRIRPAISYTQHLKYIQMNELRYTDRNPKHYEEDHLVPLELGGDPTNVNNLWPEPWAQADRSDPLENQLHHRLCNNDITLAQAQSLILSFKFTRG